MSSEVPVAATTSSEWLTVGITHTDQLAVVTISGELDLASAPALHQGLQKTASLGVREVICDLSQLAYMDSTGLSVIISAHKRMESEGTALVLLSPRPSVERVLDITGVKEFLTVRSSADGGAPLQESRSGVRRSQRNLSSPADGAG